MPRLRRGRTSDNGSRERMILAAAEIIHDEGAPALTAANLASKVGLSRQSVHYHFGTIDDLFIAIMRHGMQVGAEALKAALESPEPLKFLWESMRSYHATAELYEFRALSLRNTAISDESRRLYEDLRDTQVKIIERHFEIRGEQAAVPSVVIAFLMPALFGELGFEEAVGMSRGHTEIARYLDELFDNLSVGRPFAGN